MFVQLLLAIRPLPNGIFGMPRQCHYYHTGELLPFDLRDWLKRPISLWDPFILSLNAIYRLPILPFKHFLPGMILRKSHESVLCSGVVEVLRGKWKSYLSSTVPTFKVKWCHSSIFPHKHSRRPFSKCQNHHAYCHPSILPYKPHNQYDCRCHVHIDCHQ